MLESFIIKDFKSYSEATLKLSPLTVLVGANASGKSNALEAIRFLSWLAQGQKLSSLQYKINQDEQVVRGHIRDLFRHNEASFTLGCSLYRYVDLSISFDLRTNDELHIREEICLLNDKLLYRTIKPTKEIATDILVEYQDFFQEDKKLPTIICTDQQAVFTQLGTAARFADEYTKAKKNIPFVSKNIEKQLANILFLDPLPNKMRDYSFLSDKKLRGDGSNLSAVLYHLWNDVKNQKNILSFIQSLPEQNIKTIDFLKGPRGEVMLQLVETFGNTERKIDASLLSDGTLRVLAIASALLSAPDGSIVIIEEIDNGVHPNRAKKLLESINNIAHEKGLKILISSHNPALLDALPIEAIPHVVFCYRDKKDGFSKLVSLEDVPDYPELIAQGSLGDLVTQGVLDKFVKNFEGKDVKKKKALEWLEAVQ